MRTEISILDSDEFVLYVGPSKPQLKKWLSDRTRCFISTVGPPDIDLTKPEELVKFVCQSRQQEPPKRVLELIKDMDLIDVESMCKVYWVSGRWAGDSSKTETTMFNLFQASTESLKVLLNTYFSLREVYPYEVIQSSFLTFLTRVAKIEEQSVSDGYMKVLRLANQRFGSKIKGLMIKLGSNDSELGFINFLCELK